MRPLLLTLLAASVFGGCASVPGALAGRARFAADSGEEAADSVAPPVRRLLSPTATGRTMADTKRALDARAAIEIGLLIEPEKVPLTIGPDTIRIGPAEGVGCLKGGTYAYDVLVYARGSEAFAAPRLLATDACALPDDAERRAEHFAISALLSLQALAGRVSPEFQRPPSIRVW